MIKEIIVNRLEETVDNFYIELYEELLSKSKYRGDIAPETVFKLNSLYNQIANIVIDHIEEQL